MKNLLTFFLFCVTTLLFTINSRSQQNAYFKYSGNVNITKNSNIAISSSNIRNNQMILGSSRSDITLADRKIKFAGIVLVLDHSNGDTLLQLINQPDSIQYYGFGQVIEVNDSHLIVSAPGADVWSNADTTTKIGRVYIYKKDRNGLWEYKQKLEPDNKNRDALFGKDIALFEDLLLVSAEGEHLINGVEVSPYSGFVYVYEYNYSLGWQLVQKMKNPIPESYAGFGSSLAFNGKDLLVSAPYASNNQIIYAGRVYSFLLKDNQFEYQYNLEYRDVRNYSQYGESMAINDSILLIGSENLDNVLDGQFIKSIGGYEVYIKKNNKWEYRSKIATPTDRERTGLGAEVLITNDAIIAAAPYDEYDLDGKNQVNNSGAVYVYSLKDLELKQRIYDLERYEWTAFGFDLYFYDDILYVRGVLYDDINYRAYALRKYTKQFGLYVEETMHNDKIEVFPNPIRNYQQFQIKSNLEISSAQIVNISGQLVQKLNIDVKGSFKLEEINPGIYFLQIKSDENIIGFKKIIILP